MKLVAEVPVLFDCLRAGDSSSVSGGRGLSLFWIWLAGAIAAPVAVQNGVPLASGETEGEGALASSPAPVVVPPVQAILPAGAPVMVTLVQDLSTATSQVGDMFQVTVSEDVLHETTVVIPKGAVGHGEVTFASRRGGFGKSGIIGITLRELQLGDRKVKLLGHYREEGRDRGAVTAATWLAVGVFSGLIKGGQAGVPSGRQLKARTGEAIPYMPDAPADAADANASGSVPFETAVAVPRPVAADSDSSHHSQEQPVPTGTTTRGNQE